MLIPASTRDILTKHQAEDTQAAGEQREKEEFAAAFFPFEVQLNIALFHI
jgi:hypothetical protein